MLRDEFQVHRTTRQSRFLIQNRKAYTATSTLYISIVLRIVSAHLLLMKRAGN